MLNYILLILQQYYIFMFFPIANTQLLAIFSQYLQQMKLNYNPSIYHLPQQNKIIFESYESKRFYTEPEMQRNQIDKISLKNSNDKLHQDHILSLSNQLEHFKKENGRLVVLLHQRDDQIKMMKIKYSQLDSYINQVRNQLINSDNRLNIAHQQLNYTRHQLTKSQSQGKQVNKAVQKSRAQSSLQKVVKDYQITQRQLVKQLKQKEFIINELVKKLKEEEQKNKIRQASLNLDRPSSKASLEIKNLKNSQQVILSDKYQQLLRQNTEIKKQLAILKFYNFEAISKIDQMADLLSLLKYNPSKTAMKKNDM